MQRKWGFALKNKLVGMLVMLFLVFTILPVYAFADNYNVVVSVKNNEVTFNGGNISYVGKDITLRVVDNYSRNILVDQRKADSDGNYSFGPFTLENGDYTAYVGGISAPESKTFSISSQLPPTLSTNANLKTLQLNEGSLDFSANKTDYSVSVGNRISSVTLTAAADETNATVKIKNETTTLKVIILNEGSNLVPVEVTAQDGITKKTYNVTIKKAAAETATSGTTIPVTNEPLTITVGSGITNTKISVPNTTDGTTRTATLPFIEVNAVSTSLGGNVSVSIPEGTVVTAPDTWDGKIKLPEFQDNSSVTVSHANVSSVIEVGAPDVALTFNKAVRLLVPGQAGKSAGYVRSGVFHAITTTLGADNQATADLLPVGGEAKIDVGNDLVIWTKHFTQFVSYTDLITTPNGEVSGPGVSPLSPNTAIINVSNGGTVSLNGATITVPAGVVNSSNSSFKVTVNKVTDTSGIPMDSSSKLISDIFDISKDITGDFSKLVQVTLPFDKNKVDLNQSIVSIYWFNEETKKWIQLDNPQVDNSGATVTGSVTHFTKFAVLATTKPITPVAFTDTKGHWAEKSILELVQKGSINGYPDGTFKPDNKITRAEFVSLIVKAFNLKEQVGKEFADTKNHWAKTAIATATSQGIVNGYSDTTFGPDDAISREQMAAIIIRAAQISLVAQVTTYTDNSEISDWAKEAISTANSKGLLNGYEDGKIKPKGNTTRAEAATVILRALVLKK